MPYDAAGKAAAKEYVAGIRGRTVCERCGAQPVEWHRVEHEQDPNSRVSGLAARGHPSWSTIDRIVKNKTKRGKGRMILPTIERRAT